jgi:two-component system, chemotaxis family, CheB/CheR fusion protein
MARSVRNGKAAGSTETGIVVEVPPASGMAEPPPSKDSTKDSTKDSSRDASGASSKEPPPPPPSDLRLVVGIGASAGGLEALRVLVAHLPADSRMSYVIAQHLSPTHQSLLVQLLARETALPVREIQDGMRIEANVIYITPANRHVVLSNQHLRLTAPTGRSKPKPSVDMLLTSIAEDQGDAAVGIVLSGTGSDGANGIRAIHAAGGMTFAQDDATAKYNGMPQAAMLTDCVDFVMPPEQIARKLGSIADRSEQFDSAAESSAPPATTYERLFDLVLKRTGHNFLNYKETTVRRRLTRRMAATHVDSLKAYEDFLRTSPAEIDRLTQDILISVTSFFRDPASWKSLDARLGEMLKRKPPAAEIRIWVAACATGEEAYSVAILLLEAMHRLKRESKVQIFATDVDARALARARRGLFPKSIETNLEPSILRRYFVRVGDSYQIAKSVRDLLVFSSHDVTRDPPFLRLDLVTCRNLLIYFKPETQARLLGLFHFSLLPEGMLFLGKSENISLAEKLYEPLEERTRLYVRIDAAHSVAVTVASARRDTSFRLSVPSARQATPLPERVLGAVQKHLLPPGILVTADLELRHVYGDVSRVVRVASGAPELTLNSMMSQDLRLEIRSLTMKAKRSSGAVTTAPLLIDESGGRARITVLPVAGPTPEEPLYLVLFAPETTVAAPERRAEPRASSHDRDDIIHDLEEQLAANRENLQTVVEELETSNEELQSLNEELQSANEELQSTNEELETANEELQSTNEELTTVNEELETKTQEILAINTDLQNVKDSIAMPLVVVDNQMRLMLCNPPAARVFGATDEVLGHILFTLPCTIDVSPLKELVPQVMATGENMSMQISGFREYLMQVQPYRDGRSVVRGAVITMFDNTELIAAQQVLRDQTEVLREAERFSRATLDALPHQMCVLDERGTIIAVNATWRTFSEENGGSHETNSIGTNYLDVCRRASEAEPNEASIVETGILGVLHGGQVEFKLEYPCRTKDGDRWFRLVVSPFPGSGARRVVVVHEDITASKESTRQLRLQSRALDGSVSGILICDARREDLPIVYANRGFELLTGFAQGDLIGRNPRFLAEEPIPGHDLGVHLDDVIAQGIVRSTLRAVRRDGSTFWNDLAVYPVADEHGRIEFVVAVFTDVTHAVVAREQIQTSLERERATLAFAEVGTFDWDLRSGQVEHSQISERLWGVEGDRKGHTYALMRSRIHETDLPGFDDAVRLCLAGHSTLDIEFRLALPEDRPRWLHAKGDAIVNGDGLPTKLLCLCQDITQRRETEEQIRYIAHHDALTDLPNRTLFRDRLNQALVAARRSRSRVAVLFLDLDHFKNINDSLGHQAGDRLLQAVANRLRACVRASDTVCRNSGDEYIVLLPNMRDTGEAGHVAAKIVEALSEPHHLDGHEVMATPSIGISIFPDDGDNIDVLLKNADAAMYHAKGSGRGNYQFFTAELNARVNEHLSVSSDLRKGLREQQFRMFYQPQFSLPDRRLSGAEALIRWDHPRRGLVLPNAFIPVAEESELILDLGDWVLREVCRQVREWEDQGLVGVPIAVNFSAQQFRQRRLLQSVTEALRISGVDPALLELELTERIIMGDPDEAIEIVRGLNSLGIRLSLDDFGVGYSNLGHLKRFPFDRIKIDMSLVRELPESQSDRAIVKAIIDMGHSLNLQVLAEGVERPDELAVLETAGCDGFQGYFGSAVLSAGDFGGLLERRLN